METIGKIENLTGEVTVTHTDGTSENLTIGDDVYDGSLFDFDNAEMVWLTEDTKFDKKSDFDAPTVFNGGKKVDVDVKKGWEKEGEVEHQGEGYTVYSKDDDTIAIETDLL